MRSVFLLCLFVTAVPARGDERDRLHRLFDEEWEYDLKEDPTLATVVGDPRYDDRLRDLSLEAIGRRHAHAAEKLRRIQAIDRGKLPESERLNYDLFLRGAQLDVEGQRFPGELLQLDQLQGVYTELTSLAEIIPRKNAEDLERFLRRMDAFPRLVDQALVLLRQGLAKGITPPRVTLRDVGRLIGNQIFDDPAQSPLYQIVFLRLPPGISKEDGERLQASARRSLRERVIPALTRLKAFVEREYEPGARRTIALSAVPDGAAWYAYAARRATTVPLSPGEIHALGLKEVARIRAAMDAVMRRTGFRGTLAEFFTHLRTAPQFFYADKEALLTGYRDICKRIDPELPRFFGRLPRLTYGVRQVPVHSEKTQTTAYYYEGSFEAGRPGWFYANTYDLKTRPKWEMEALTLHEAVPGHHLQLALAQELAELPNFRRFNAGYTAFVEGWGLYAESLGPDLGLYQDPYAKFGQLTYEMWRAIRLVLDTGIHAKGWSREQAIAFFRDNAGKSEHDIEVEVDRYIVWPGQALAYKVGELKIKELRALAEKTLGPRFDIRAFHDAVLGGGAVPLDVLEARLHAWIESRRGGS
jgi:uncharacterized protein (DUF885 family)